MVVAYYGRELMSAPDDQLVRAMNALRAGNTREAWSAARTALGYPREAGAAQLAEGLGIMATVADGAGAEALSSALRAAANRPDEIQPLYDGAYQLYEARSHDVAAALLARANRLAPGQPAVVNELATNLEAMFRHADAVDVLRRSPSTARDPMGTYLLGFNSLMTGDVRATRGVAAGLNGLVGADNQWMADTLTALLRRADAVSAAVTLDDSALTAWHLVVNGSVLLHESPHGYDDGMRGRYAFVNDSYGRIRDGIDRVAAVLAASGRQIERVVAGPDRGSRIVALAAAEVLDLDHLPWGSRHGNALIALYDLDRVGDVDALGVLRDHADGRILWAHASNWTDPFPYSPDLTTMLYQHCDAPWEGGGVSGSEPDDASDAEIASRIVEAAPDTESPSSVSDIQHLVRSVGASNARTDIGLFRDHGPRSRQHAGSPVASSRFL